MLSGRVSGASLRGKDTMKRNLRLIAIRYPKVLGNATLEETKIEHKEVQRRTPVDTGELRDSERVIGPFYERTIYCAIIVTAAHALLVHENLEAFHRIGQAKYLESVLLEAQQWLGARIAKRANLRLAANGLSR